MDITLPNNHLLGQAHQLSTIEIRELAVGEWQTYRAVRMAALTSDPSAFSSTAADASRLGEAGWRRRMRQRSTFLATAGNDPIGVVSVRRSERAGAAELISMWVDPAWRGRSVGDRLVQAVISWGAEHGYTAIHLWVADANQRAEQLYARHGFIRTGMTQPMGSGHSGRLEFEMLFTRPPS
jgi:GNAT superfamily N-acetyltransferase